MRVRIDCSAPFIAEALMPALKMHKEFEIVESGEDCSVKVDPRRLAVCLGGKHREWPLPRLFGRGAPSLEDIGADTETLYVEDLVDEILRIISGESQEFRPILHTARPEEVRGLYEAFRAYRTSLMLPPVGVSKFAKKLYASHLASLPVDGICFGMVSHCDSRGAFTELFKTQCQGQISVNRIKPGQVKGNHWHRTKSEIFIVVSGEAEIAQWRVGESEKIVVRASGDRIEAVRILPGFVHSIANPSVDADAIVVMWASEPFNPQAPDTYLDV